MSHPVGNSRRIHKHLLLVSSLLVAGLAVGWAGEKVSATTQLTAKNFAEIRNAILLPSENRWSEIPWRPNLGEAIGEARKEDKPILLWMMNGHPCGMT